MPEITHVYWRDIPAQVIVGQGRRAAKMPLPERFEQAIDRCAMQTGARESDAYLADWRKAPAGLGDGAPEEVAAREAARLEAAYDGPALRALIENGGYSHTSAPTASPADPSAESTL